MTRTPEEELPLATRFVALVPNVSATASLERALEAMLAAGRASWPSCGVDPLAFASHVARHLRDEPEPAVGLVALHAADLYFTCACAHGDSSAIADLDRRWMTDLSRYLERRRSVSGAIIDEVCQSLRERLLLPRDGGPGKIADYAGRGSFEGWLRVAAVRTAANLVRAERGRAEKEEASPLEPAFVDPELLLLRERFGEAFRAALRDGFAALSARDRTLFRLHFLDGLTLEKLAVVFHVSTATAGRWMVAARASLRENVLAALQTRLRVSETELQSLLGVVRSKLDVSLSGLLREGL